MKQILVKIRETPSHINAIVTRPPVFIFSHFRTEYVVPGRSLSVRLSVCLWSSLISTIFDRFCWNLDHIVLTKIWDDTFLKFSKFCFDDVITAILLFFNAALSHLQFLFNFLQTWSFFSSTHSFVWDCNPAFSAIIFYPIWPPKITENLLKTKVETNEKEN